LLLHPASFSAIQDLCARSFLEFYTFLGFYTLFVGMFG
jgi:hypothetical protein